MANDVSIQVIRRLPKYYRFLTDLESKGITKISSTKLARIMGSTASQIRQDLNCFGGFGQQGYGYPVSLLKEEIGRILGLDRVHNAILLGAGNLGRAIATNLDFEKIGFRLCAIVERDPELIGISIRGVRVMNKEQFLSLFEMKDFDTVILAISEEHVRNAVNELYSRGVRNYWNFTHYDILADHPDAIVEDVRMSDSLMTLCYRINHPQEQ